MKLNYFFLSTVFCFCLNSHSIELEIRSELLNLSDQKQYDSISPTFLTEQLNELNNKNNFNSIEQEYIFALLRKKSSDDSNFKPLLSKIECYDSNYNSQSYCDPFKSSPIQTVKEDTRLKENSSFIKDHPILISTIGIILGISLYNWGKDKEIIIQLPF